MDQLYKEGGIIDDDSYHEYISEKRTSVPVRKQNKREISMASITHVFSAEGVKKLYLTFRYG